MGIRTYGPNAVDWEERVDFDRLRRERLARLEEALERSDLGALLTFDFHNIRYMTSTHIGTWAMDKLIRFALLPRGGKPIVWDFGSAARHHQIYNPWLEGRTDDPEQGRARPGISTLRGAFNPAAGIAEEVARKIHRELEERGLLGEPLGVDVVEMPVLAALQAAGLQVVDGQQVFLEARRIKTADEIALLATAATLVDSAYEELYGFLRPGVRENECVGLVSKVLYDLGSEHVEGVNAISGERCSPHPHVYSDRILRPGDPAFFDILHRGGRGHSGRLRGHHQVPGRGAAGRRAALLGHGRPPPDAARARVPPQPAGWRRSGQPSPWTNVISRSTTQSGCFRRKGMAMANRLLLRGGYVLTVDPELGDLPKGDVLIDGDTIAAVASQVDADAEVVDVEGSVVIPGFVDTHRHTWEAAIRGCAPNATLDD